MSLRDVCYLSLDFETLFVYTVLLAYTARRTKMSLWCESMCVCVEGILGIIHIIAKNIHAIGCASNSWNSMKIQLRSFKIFRGALPRTPPGATRAAHA